MGQHDPQAPLGRGECPSTPATKPHSHGSRGSRALPMQQQNSSGRVSS